MNGLVFKIQKAAGTFAAIAYNDKKEHKGAGELLVFRNFGPLQGAGKPSQNDVKSYLGEHSAMNTRIKGKQFHAILSCKGQTHTYAELAGIAETMLQRLGYGENPYLIWGHSDTKNNHVHIVTSRVGTGGKKISDNFEQIRSMDILNEILGRSPKESFAASLDHARTFSYTTLPQFLLLMENKGYGVQKKDDCYLFSKWGKTQGSMSGADIEKGFQTRRGTERIKEITALIKKHKPANSVKLTVSTLLQGHAKKPGTALTDYLQKNHGLEFVFFKNKNHDQPFGYSIIDHQFKCVLKGSEVMPLKELLATGENELLAPVREIPLPSPHQGSLIPRKPLGHFSTPETLGKQQDREEPQEKGVFAALVDDALRENQRLGRGGGRLGKKTMNRRRRSK